MEIIVSSLAVVMAAGCFLAVVASDVKDSHENDEEQG